jgi:hypothetical protein
MPPEKEEPPAKENDYFLGAFRIRRQPFSPKRIEIALWITAAAISFWIYYRGMLRWFRPSLAPVIFGAAFLLIPLLCRLIFNALPIEMLRSKVSGVPLRSEPPNIPHEDRVPWSLKETDFLHTDFALQYLQSLATASRQIAEKIYLRSGVYLLIGVMVAFSGLAFFYYQQSSGTETRPADTFKDSLLHTLPRFGILFFIETIAFFFLRQYRTAMDEYRYFEAIKRRREENFVLLSLLASENPIDLTKLPQQASLYSDVAALAQGQTTDLLESRKLNKDETAILEKVVDAITKIKP